jgi:hypothetical protein
MTSLWAWLALTLAVAFLAVAVLVVDETWKGHR